MFSKKFILTNLSIVFLTMSAFGEPVYRNVGTYLFRVSPGNCELTKNCSEPTVLGEGDYSCGGNSPLTVDQDDYDWSLANRDASCAIEVYTQTVADTIVDDKIESAKLDFKAHVDRIPEQLIVDGAVANMKNNLQEQLSTELTNEVDRKVEELVRARMDILVPLKVAEEVQKQLEARGL